MQVFQDSCMVEGTELPGSTQGALETTSTFHGEFLASLGTGGEAPVGDSRSQSGCLEVPPTLSLGHVLDCPRVLDGFPNFQLHMVKYPQTPAGPVPSAVQTIPLGGTHPPPIRGNSTNRSVSIVRTVTFLAIQNLRGLHWSSSLSIQ